MAVKAVADNPQELLNKIKAAIRSGSVKTWVLDKDGDFSHASQQLLHKAWFRPVVQQNVLMFNILGVKGTAMSTRTYAVYHGRFVEMLLSQFDKDFSSATSTALATDGDLVKDE